MLDKLSGPVLAVDSGNALFRNAGVATADDKQRAAFILEVMGRLGTKVAAVGQRDLSAGAAWLVEQAARSKVKWLSANLRQKDKLLFDASTVIDVSGIKVALVGVTAPGPVAPEPDVQGGPTLVAVKAALEKLGPRDVTVVLAATSYADAMQLATGLKGVDLVIQSGEFRGTQPPQRLDDASALLLASGQRGQALGKLTLALGTGKGPFVDLSSMERDRLQLDFLADQVKTLETRLSAAKDKVAAAQLKKTLGELKQRQKELKAAVDKKVGPAARTALLEWALLGQDVADDAALKAEVLKFEPTYSGSH